MTGMADYDVESVRAHFPALAEGAAHFDGPGGSQTPDVVAAAVAATLTSAIANRGEVTPAERRAESIVGECRAALGDLLATDPRGVVFGRSATQLNMDLARTLAKDWGPGDEVVVTRLDHDGNVRPWVIAAERAGATVRWADFDPATGELDPEAVASVLSGRTRLVAVTGASNLVGTRPDLPAISGLVHGAGALLAVDAVHLAAHASIDRVALGADLLVCSPYKFLGPHCGVLAADPELLETLHPDKLLPSSDTVPERFELGTLPYELMAGTTAAIEFLASLSGLAAEASRRDRLVDAMARIEAHEDPLRTRLEEAVTALPGVTCWSRAARRTSTLLFTFANHDPQDVRNALAHKGINAPAGNFYAIECSRRLGLGSAGGLRLGLAPYTNGDDVDRAVDALTAVVGG
jgi:cysteine desulfurase family protein (TIGR01976 family)